MNLGLDGKTVLITGATGAIGSRVADRFAVEGAGLILVARDAAKLAAQAERLKQVHGGECRTIAADLATEAGIVAVTGSCGRIDILVNNAGAIPAGNLLDISMETWRRAWDLKVFGYIALTRHFLKAMSEAGGGAIVNTIGSAGESPDFDYVCGSTGNAALMAFTRAVGGRSLDMGVRVVGINPGAVETERLRKLLSGRAAETYGDPGEYRRFFDRYPAGRPAEADEVADLIAFVASTRGAYLSGTIFTIDGGMASRRSL
ncbi:short-chain dehydrogenase/reductase [Paracoccus sp. MC1862]|uniref:short-chain dehydrogenase/reductase n=1 Tax=Paracoccus sp. MC1862 TaxID=2760307 RepID=UPI001604403B|nr:short-chain dehydrogenase/reductase [Paracoccus sp. MC1862]MBB1499321.1 SDR family NAD(P)-dependent oxidoreductase [Paracoccus sp. MC1862]QQO46629.1 SDR family NAD(P)-dependent oxidoreductase [Paracoccus sp. MC1862]